LRSNNVIDQIVEKLSGKKEVLAIILYGSFARGDFGPRSDVDIFVIVENTSAIEKVENCILEIKTERTIQPIIRSLDKIKETDSGLLKNIFQQGKIIFLRRNLDIPVSLMLSLKPYRLITFNLSNLDQKTKTKFNYALYGVKKKNYEYKGILEKNKGRKVSKGSILIPEETWNNLKEFFDSYSIDVKVEEVWL